MTSLRKTPPGASFLLGLAEVEADVEFLLEEFGAAVGVDQIFGGVAVGGDAKADGPALKRGAQVCDALAVRMIVSFGYAQ